MMLLQMYIVINVHWFSSSIILVGVEPQIVFLRRSIQRKVLYISFKAKALSEDFTIRQSLLEVSIGSHQFET